ncbi:hypothetical protein KKE54_07535 [bacterium]|nr:hypothetical protein [bacterium]
MLKHKAPFLAMLLISSAMVTGCSSHKAVPASQTETTRSIEKEKPVTSISVPAAAKEVTAKNTKLASNIADAQAKMAQLDAKIEQTPPGAEKAKLVKEEIVLEKHIEALRGKQIDNAKVYKEVGQENTKKLAKLREESAGNPRASEDKNGSAPDGNQTAG